MMANDVPQELADGDEDWTLREHRTIMAAFRVGYLSQAARTRCDSWWEWQAFDLWLDQIEDEFRPAKRGNVRHQLRRLNDLMAEVCESTYAIELFGTFGTTWTRGALPADPNLHQDAKLVLAWVALATHFGTLVHDAVRVKSAYRAWFNCGHRLGECAASARGEQPVDVELLKKAIRKLPWNFLRIFDWLQSFCKFDFASAGPQEWIAGVPRYDGIVVLDEEPQSTEIVLPPTANLVDRFPKVTDYSSLLDYVYGRLCYSLDFMSILLAENPNFNVPATSDGNPDDWQPRGDDVGYVSLGKMERDSSRPYLDPTEILDTLAEAETSRRPKNRGGGRRPKADIQERNRLVIKAHKAGSDNNWIADHFKISADLVRKILSQARKRGELPPVKKAGNVK